VALVASLLSLTQVAGDSGTTILRTGSKKYTLFVVSTPTTQQLGLGQRASLPKDQGMLFVFGQAAQQCFWMKDMHFPLDMIWLSPSHRVEHIQPDVSPKTYPNSFCPDVTAQYVIELNAGQASAAGIYTGERLSF
jgi:hypothetical protein